MAKRATKKPDREESRRTLTDVEWAILEVVWTDEPCAAGSVQESLQEEHGWAYSTVKTTMDRMVAKGLLKTKAIRNLNLFSSLITHEEAKRTELKQCLRRAFQGALTPMIQFLFDEEELTEQELDELRKLVRRSKRKS